jgi:nicotinamide-nucleotide amidase
LLFKADYYSFLVVQTGGKVQYNACRLEENIVSKVSALCQQLAALLGQQNLIVATAESCTGGEIGARFTDLPGSSAWFNGGIISYTNAAKSKLLDVSVDSLKEQGAVSEKVVLQMAQGACEKLNADLAVAVSGVAGPGGGSEKKPVGTVWIAWAWQDKSRGATSRLFQFAGDRDMIRKATVEEAISGLIQQLTPALASADKPLAKEN